MTALSRWLLRRPSCPEADPAWTVFTVGAWRWQVASPWVAVLRIGDQMAPPRADALSLPDLGLPLETWQRAGILDVVKAGKHRTVWRLRLPQATLYVKFYPLADWQAWLRQKLRPTKARTEALTALRLQQLGIRTVTPLAWGETAQGASCLITLGLQEAVTVRDVLEGRQPADLHPAERRRLTAELADLLARMHDQSIVHDDLHAGNLLLARGPDGDWQLHLVDLHAVRFKSRLTWQQAQANLVMLNRWFVQRSSRSDRLRFWLRYVSARSAAAGLNADIRTLAQDLESKTWQSCLRFWQKRDRRFVTENAYIRRICQGFCAGFAVRDLPAELIQELADDPDRPFASASAMLKASPSSAVVVLRRSFSGQTVHYVWKRFAVTRWTDPWVHLVRPTPAQRSWLNGHRMRECGLPTPRPLLVLHRKRRGLIGESYLLTEYLENAVPLRDAWNAVATRPGRRILIEGTARLIREMHRRHLSHRDLKAANLLVNERGELFVIDLVGVERHRVLDHKRRIQNLARLHVSFWNDPTLRAADKLHFLTVYLQAGLHGMIEWKAWWRAIAAATQRKIEQNRRRRRPLS